MSAPRDPVASFGRPRLGEYLTAINIVTGGFPYTMTDGDFLVACNKANPAAAVTVTLGTPWDGRIVGVKDWKGDADTNNITVSGGDKNIEGAATDVISTARTERWYVYSAAAGEWKRLWGGRDAVPANAVGGVQLSAGAFRRLVFTGKNGAGACTATGLKVGDKVIGITNLTDASTGTSSFEATITVADQIQQSAAGDLSAKKFDLLVVVKS